MLPEAYRQSGFKERILSSINPADVPNSGGTRLSCSGFILFLVASVQLFSKPRGGFLFFFFLALLLIHNYTLSLP